MLETSDPSQDPLEESFNPLVCSHFPTIYRSICASSSTLWGKNPWQKTSPYSVSITFVFSCLSSPSYLPSHSFTGLTIHVLVIPKTTSPQMSSTRLLTSSRFLLHGTTSHSPASHVHSFSKLLSSSRNGHTRIRLEGLKGMP